MTGRRTTPAGAPGADGADQNVGSGWNDGLAPGGSDPIGASEPLGASVSSGGSDSSPGEPSPGEPSPGGSDSNGGSDSVGGSDSSGGAGIQADIRTVTMLGGHPMTAVTAITAQNTVGVTGVHPIPAEMVLAQPQ